jgi:hypothetical protein
MISKLQNHSPQNNNKRMAPLPAKLRLLLQVQHHPEISATLVMMHRDPKKVHGNCSWLRLSNHHAKHILHLPHLHMPDAG